MRSSRVSTASSSSVHSSDVLDTAPREGGGYLSTGYLAQNGALPYAGLC